MRRAVARWAATPAGKADGRQRTARYRATIKGQITRERAHLNYNIKARTTRIAELERELHASP